MTAIRQLLAHVRLGDAQSHAGLTMFPLLDGGGREPPYLALRQALALGTVAIEEVSDAGSVPTLAVRNDGDTPVLLLHGEELIGAKQNRVVNVTMLVPAKSLLKIPVSCVEQGRWHFKSRKFGDSEHTMYSDGRRRHLRDVELSLRQRGTREADQQRVWNDIRGKMGRMGAASQTGAMSDAYAHTARSRGEYLEAFHPVDGQVGALFLLDGGWAGLDLFDSPATLGVVFPKLVNSWAIDALEPRQAGRGSPAVTRAEALLAAVAVAEEWESPAVGLGREVRLQHEGLTAAALVHDDTVIHLTAFEQDE
jgi:hypothetical protein